MTGAACAAMEWKCPDAGKNWTASANSARREPCLMFDRNHLMSAYASAAGSGVLSARSRCYTITSQGSSLAVNGVRCRLCSHQAYSRECGFDATLPHAISVVRHRSVAARTLQDNGACKYSDEKMRTRRRRKWRTFGLSAVQLFSRDVVARFSEALDALLDVSERLQAGLDCLGRDILQHIGRDRVAQAVEIIDELTAARGEKQPVGAPVLRVVAPLEQTVLDQAIEQAHQRDRLQFKHVGQIDLRQSLLLPQSKQYDPLRARGASALGAVIDVVAQEPGALYELRNQLAFRIERHKLPRSLKAFQLFRIPQAIVCLHIKCTHIISVRLWNRFEDPLLSFSDL